MLIRLATALDYARVVEFYDNIIDDMQDAKYHPMWQKPLGWHD